MNDFNLCPVCGSKNIKSPAGRKWLCGECGFDLYNNTAAAVGLLIFDKDKRLLLEKRAKEPRKGFLLFQAVLLILMNLQKKRACGSAGKKLVLSLKQ